MLERVIINEVGPPDGLQNQPKVLSVEQRLSLIRALPDAGVQSMEVGIRKFDASIGGLNRAKRLYPGV